jgi:uncharacterized protein YjbI with pentapeptide repeats
MKRRPELVTRWESGSAQEVRVLLLRAQEYAQELSRLHKHRSHAKTNGLRAKFDAKIASAPDPATVVLEARALARSIPHAEEVPSHFDLRGVRLSGCFDELDLSWADLSFVRAPADSPILSFWGCNLESSRFQGNKATIDLVKCNLREADLSGANLVRNYFGTCTLQRSRFDKAKLAKAIFSRADISGCSFRGANLSSAAFAKSNCIGADFTEANLSGAFFDGAVIDESTTFLGANLTGAYFSEEDGQALTDYMLGKVLKRAAKILKATQPALSSLITEYVQRSAPPEDFEDVLSSLPPEPRELLADAIEQASIEER